MSLAAKIDDLLEKGDEQLCTRMGRNKANGSSHLAKRPPSVIGLIDSVLDDAKERHHFFRPSMVCHEHGCDRANVFHYQDALRSPQRVENFLQRIMDAGTKTHSMLQEYLSKHPDIWFIPEAKVDAEVEGARIRGSCDGVFVRRTDLYRWGLEIKTINATDFKVLKTLNEWKDVYKLKQTIRNKELAQKVAGHIDQLTIYCVLNNLKWITLLYINRDSQFMCEFQIPFDEVRWARIKKRIKHLKRFVDKRTLPRYDVNTCDPSFCGFVKTCRKNGAPV